MAKTHISKPMYWKPNISDVRITFRLKWTDKTEKYFKGYLGSLEIPLKNLTDEMQKIIMTQIKTSVIEQMYPE